MTKSKERRSAHAKLDDYIDWLIENDGIAATDGTDGWTLSIDQHANEAANVERRKKRV